MPYTTSSRRKSQPPELARGGRPSPPLPTMASAEMAAMTPQGESASWLNQKSNQKNIANEFLAQLTGELKAAAGSDFETMPEEVACAEEFYATFATFLCFKYRIPAGRVNQGKPLDEDSAIPVFTGVIRQSQQRFSKQTISEESKVRCQQPARLPCCLDARCKAPPAARSRTRSCLALQRFFNCFNGDNSVQALWLRGIKAKMNRIIVHRKMEAGEAQQDGAATCIYLDHVREMSAALARANTKEAADRKLAIKTLWRSSGRASEPSYMSYEGVKWDPLHKSPFVECPQAKPSKVKLIPFVSGVDRHADWFIDYGDSLILDRGKMGVGEHINWLITDIGGAKNAGTKLSGYIKALQPPGRQGALKKYSELGAIAPSLPHHPTAAGLRPGASEMLAMSMPAEIAVNTTGHDLTSMTALWEYLRARLALCMPGAVVLSGFPAFPWGQLGKGPQPPTLEALVVGGVSMERLEEYVDRLFSFHDRTPIMLRKGGELRPMVLATVATLIMYYQERFQAHEMELVLASMRDAHAAMSMPHVDAHSILIEWGRAIRARFDVDNVHLTGMHAHSGFQQTIAALQQLGGSVSRLHASQSATGDSVASLVAAVERLEAAMRARTAPPAAGVPSPTAMPPPPRPAPAATPPQEAPAAMPQGELSPFASPLPSLQVTSAVPASGHFGSLGSDATQQPANGEYKLKGVEAADFYLHCMALGGNVPKTSSQDESRAKLCFDWFNDMASPSEREQLLKKPRDEPAAIELGQQLNKHVLNRIALGYTAINETSARLMTNKLMVTSIESHNRKVKVINEASAFAAFRRGEPAPDPLRRAFQRAEAPRPSLPRQASSSVDYSQQDEAEAIQTTMSSKAPLPGEGDAVVEQPSVGTHKGYDPSCSTCRTIKSKGGPACWRHKLISVQPSDSSTPPPLAQSQPQPSQPAGSSSKRKAKTQLTPLDSDDEAPEVPVRRQLSDSSDDEEFQRLFGEQTGSANDAIVLEE